MADGIDFKGGSLNRSKIFVGFGNKRRSFILNSEVVLCHICLNAPNYFSPLCKRASGLLVLTISTVLCLIILDFIVSLKN